MNLTACLVGNKIDLQAPRQVDHDEAERYARQHNLLFFETSAATGVNVEEVFTQTAKVVYDKTMSGLVDTALQSSGVSSFSGPAGVSLTAPAPKEKKGCCS